VVQLRQSRISHLRCEWSDAKRPDGFSRKQLQPYLKSGFQLSYLNRSALHAEHFTRSKVHVESLCIQGDGFICKDDLVPAGLNMLIDGMGVATKDHNNNQLLLDYAGLREVSSW